MDDADMDLAVRDVVQSRALGIAGQLCNAAERVYVHESIAREFIDRIVDEMRNVKVGDPTQADVVMGPLVSKKALDTVGGMVTRALKDGATLACGGTRPGSLSKGFFYSPTVLTNCRQGMEIMRKEVFGPVLPIMTFRTLDEAIELANDCEYGLTSSIHTRSVSTALRAVNELEFGETYVNRPNMEAVQGFHAGWKKSGIGGEDGRHGVQAYLQTHIAYINYGA
jgi:lactaldehyde dehydrogenase/glycolaldehyde dehydrogenase